MAGGESNDEDEDRYADVLVLILELHSLLVQPPENKSGSVNGHGINLERLVGQVCTFISMFQHLQSSNRLAVLACDSRGVRCLYEDLATLDSSQQRVEQAGAASSLLNGLESICEEISDAPLDAVVDTRNIPAALSSAMCMVNRVLHAADSNEFIARPRLLVLHSCPDVTSQYVACMNAAFAARRLGVPIDAMPLTGEIASYMELAASLTNGMYVAMKNPASLLQHLACCFLASMSIRECMELPDSQGLTFKGTCFCHVRPIDSGFVCSVCLSVFCTPHEKCMTCGTEFTGVARSQKGI